MEYLPTFKDAKDRRGGEVFLVGAGPGDPELLTLKALRALRAADVIVHDRLVSDEILDMARPGTERIYVGKRPSDHAVTQDAIGRLLVDLARAGRRVVRLKGGDPFVFGRGGEELQTLNEAGIVCHVIPGITAATGCAAHVGIPLTHRDFAQSCVLVTGHDRDGLADLDWAALAAPRQTLAIYMGLANLGAIAGRLIAHGLAPTTPAAVIENGTTRDERMIVDTLGGIDAAVRDARITAPSLIIIGEVVGLARSKTATGMMEETAA